MGLVVDHDKPTLLGEWIKNNIRLLNGLTMESVRVDTIGEFVSIISSRVFGLLETILCLVIRVGTHRVS